MDKIVEAESPYEASLKRAELLADLARNGQPETTERTRLSQYVKSYVSLKMPTWKAATRALYASVIDNHVLPVLGDYFLDAITKDDLVIWRKGMIEAGAKPASINGRFRVLKRSSEKPSMMDTEI